MNRFSALLLGGALVLAFSANADRVNLTDLGISVWVPSGWELQNWETTDSTRLYLMDDTTISSNGTVRRHSGSILFQAQSGVLASKHPINTDPTRQWVLDEGDVWALVIYTAPLGGVWFLNDTTLVSGLFAREVYGQSLDSVGDSVRTRYILTTAHGDVGWDFWVESDTSDADTAIATYVNLLDSVLVDTTVSVLPVSGIKANNARWPVSQALSSVGGALRIHALGRPKVEALDLMGRAVPGTLSFGGGGVWLWRPQVARTTTVLARVRADGSIWTRRVVLDP